MDYIRIRRTADDITSNASSFVGPGVPAWPGGSRAAGDRSIEETKNAQDSGRESSTEFESPQTEFIPRRSFRIRRHPDRLYIID